MLLGAAMIVGLTACGKPEPKKQQVLDHDAKLAVNVKYDTNMRVSTSDLPTIEGDTQEILTPRQVVEQTRVFITNGGNLGAMRGAVLAISSKEYDGEEALEMKDVANARFLLPGDMIIRKDVYTGETSLNPDFLTAEDIRVSDENKVIAYIPQSVVKKAWEEVQTAYNAGDYERVYKLFDEAYTAIPCTQRQWEALKAKGES